MRVVCIISINFHDVVWLPPPSQSPSHTQLPRRLSWDKFFSNGKWWQADEIYYSMAMRWRVPCRSWFILAKWVELSRPLGWWRNVIILPEHLPAERERVRWATTTVVDSRPSLLLLYCCCSAFCYSPACLSNSIHSQFSHAHIFCWIFLSTFTQQHFKLTFNGKLDLKCDCKFLSFNFT